MPLTRCSCGLPMQLRGSALFCSHCDVGNVHVASSCERCRTTGLGRIARS